MTDDQVKEVYVGPGPEKRKLKADNLSPALPRSRRWPTCGRLPSTMPTQLSAAST
jgi:hypothetical protein